MWRRTPLFSLYFPLAGLLYTSAAFRVLRVIIVTEWNELQRVGLYSHLAIDQLLFPSSRATPLPRFVFFTADAYHRLPVRRRRYTRVY